MNFLRIISGGVGRQLISGLANVLALAYLSTFAPLEEVAKFNTTLVFVFAVSAFIGIPFYPAIYHHLSVSNNGFKVINSIILSSFFSTVFLGFFVLSFANIFGFLSGVQEFVLLISFVMASTIASVPLGLGRYSLFNLLEITPALVLLFGVFFVSGSYPDLVLLAASSYLLKIFLFLFIFRRHLLCGLEFGEFFVKAIKFGFKAGSVGAYQTISFRVLFFLLLFLYSPTQSVFVAIIWPIIEKMLVIPQAANAVMFGAIRKVGADSVRLKSIYKSLLVVLVISVFVLYFAIILWERFLASADYKGISTVAPLCIFFMFVQSIRVLAANFLNSLSHFREILIDTTVFFCAQFVVYVLVKFYQMQSDFAAIFLLGLFSASVTNLFFAARKIASKPVLI